MSRARGRPSPVADIVFFAAATRCIPRARSFRGRSRRGSTAALARVASRVADRSNDARRATH
jgi:hypothetical protein